MIYDHDLNIDKAIKIFKELFTQDDGLDNTLVLNNMKLCQILMNKLLA